MGRKARIRAARKAGEKPGPTVRSTKETKTIKRLRKIAPYINTLADIERMCSQSTNPRWFRETVGPMLREHLVCCAQMYLATRPGVEAKSAVIKHSEWCPTRKLIQAPKSAIIRPGSVTEQLSKEGRLII